MTWIHVVEFILAYIFGIAFQYYGMGFKKHDQPGQALKDAVKADTLSLVAFEIGMFGWGWPLYITCYL